MNTWFRAALAGAVVGATLGFAVAQLMPTSHADAMAMAAALVPDGADAPPTGEFDYPFWYGGRYEAVQSFVGGARDRPHLADVMTAQLDRHGWRVVGVDQRPGATLITAIQDDLEVLVSARHLPATDPVEGLVTVTYRSEPPTAALSLVGAVSGAASGVLTLVSFGPGMRPRRDIA
jgi:hypothetical protein